MEDTEEIRLPALEQIGVVVKDLDKTMEYYTSTFGVGPWRVVEVDYPEVMVHDRICPWKVKVAFASLGPVELELIQVIAGRSIHSEFLEEGREGLHHLGFLLEKEAKERFIALTHLNRLSTDPKLDFGFNEWIKAQYGTPAGQDWQTWSAAMYLYAAACIEKGKAVFFE